MANKLLLFTLIWFVYKQCLSAVPDYKAVTTPFIMEARGEWSMKYEVGVSCPEPDIEIDIDVSAKTSEADLIIGFGTDSKYFALFIGYDGAFCLPCSPSQIGGAAITPPKGQGFRAPNTGETLETQYGATTSTQYGGAARAALVNDEDQTNQWEIIALRDTTLGQDYPMKLKITGAAGKTTVEITKNGVSSAPYEINEAFPDDDDFYLYIGTDDANTEQFTLRSITQTGECPVCDPSDCDDNNSCTDEQCIDGQCTNVPNTDFCDDGDACTVDDICSNGVCRGADMDCNDDNPCTDDVCIEGACDNSVFNTDPCDDGDACTEQDTCSNGACSGTDKRCDDGNPCTNNQCIDGVCNYSEFNADPCDDGDKCTENDTCNNGVCEGEDKMCDSDLCFDGSCDAETGDCKQEPSELNLGCTEDNDVCNGITECDPDSGCITSDSLDCVDDNKCNGEETCDATTGCQAGTAIVCEDNNACTDAGTCDSETGLCSFELVVECGDGDMCNGEERCNTETGACDAGVDVICKFGEECDALTGDCDAYCDDFNIDEFMVTCSKEYEHITRDIRTNKKNIKSNDGDIKKNKINIKSNDRDIRTNKQNIKSNDKDIGDLKRRVKNLEKKLLKKGKKKGKRSAAILGDLDLDLNDKDLVIMGLVLLNMIIIIYCWCQQRKNQFKYASVHTVYSSDDEQKELNKL